MWVALKKLGVPKLLVDIIKSFHTNMKARTRDDGELLEEIEVNSGLSEGCMMIYTWFNLYVSAVAEKWMKQCRMRRLWEQSCYKS